MVSVFMLTYNQKDFIAQAIDGVLMQETNFPVTLVIGEDYSTDGTREICMDYEKKFPDKIKLILNENLGLGANYVKTLSACGHKYVAICDGDDYWTDPLKLQKQVDFLENNPGFDIVFTNNENLYPSGKIDIRDTNKIPEVSSFVDIVHGNYVASVTVIFRNQPLPESMKEWIKGLPFGDWPTYLWILKDGGKVKFINEVTAVYRKDFGTSAKLRESRFKMGEINLYILRNLKADLHFQNRKKELRKSMVNYKKGLMASYNIENRHLSSFLIFADLFFKMSKKNLLKAYLYSLKRGFKNA